MGNDCLVKRVLIVKQVLLIATIAALWRIVGRICLLILDFREFTHRDPQRRRV